MNSISLFLAVFTAFTFLTCILGKDEINSKLVFSDVSRKIDLASQLAKCETSITLENEGDSTIKLFFFAVEPSLVDKLAYVGVSVSIFIYNCAKTLGRLRREFETCFVAMDLERNI